MRWIIIEVGQRTESGGKKLVPVGAAQQDRIVCCVLFRDGVVQNEVSFGYGCWLRRRLSAIRTEDPLEVGCSELASDEMISGKSFGPF